MQAFLFSTFPCKEVLRAVTCLAIHDNIALPMDVIHTTTELYSLLWTFASPKQCDPFMPDLLIGDDDYNIIGPEMLIDSTGTIAKHIGMHDNSIVLVTPCFTMDEVIAGYVPPCRLRFPK
eukprot:PhF_6_TR3747/c0_g4_i2/m.5408